MAKNAGQKLYDAVRTHVSNPRTAALLTETEFIPVGGVGTPIAPPTYASTSRNPADKGVPTFAVSDGIPMPEATEEGWYQSLQRNPDTGEVRRAPQVILDSVGSQSGRAETALLASGALGARPPGIFIAGNADEQEGTNVSEDNTESSASLSAQLQDAFANEISSWDAAHRQVDAWIKFAETPDGKQVWEGGKLSDGSILKDLIVTASPEQGDLLYSLFPNSAIYGYWLSSGTALRHRQPRAYSSQIVGYGASGVVSAATMLDESGGASSSSRVEVKNHKLSSGGKKKPSDVGFGPVPGSPAVRAFSCELILQRATISLAPLRSLKFDDAERSEAAITVLVLLSMLGHALANEDGFLRSSCSLTPVSTKWGWREHGKAPSDIATLEVDSAGDVQDALDEALKVAGEVGLAFEEPIQLRFSGAQRTLIEERVGAQDSKQGADPDGE